MFASTTSVLDLRGEGALLDYLVKSRSKFLKHAIQNPVSKLRDLKMIHLRGPKNTVQPDQYTYGLDHVDCEDRPLMNEFPEVKALVSFLQGSLSYSKVGNVMMSEIQGGAFIEPHCDPGLYFEQYHRIHVPIITDPRCFAYSVSYPITSEAKQIVETNLAVGFAWELNNCDIHWFEHKGVIPRYHVVLDVS